MLPVIIETNSQTLFTKGTETTHKPCHIQNMSYKIIQTCTQAGSYPTGGGLSIGTYRLVKTTSSTKCVKIWGDGIFGVKSDDILS